MKITESPMNDLSPPALDPPYLHPEYVSTRLRAPKEPLLTEHLMKNVFFDTCVYHLPGIELLTKVVPVDNVLFASEMLGAVKGIDPETGHHYDDTKRYVDQVKALNDADRYKIFEGNARRVYPRLDRSLAKRGKPGRKA